MTIQGKTVKDYKKTLIENMDDNGLIHSDSDNPILFTIEAYSLFQAHGIFDIHDAKRLHRAINSVAMRDKDTGEIIKGLYTRRPGTEDDYVRKDQWDNYEAIACSAMFGDDFRKYAKEIDNYGKKFFWYSYDNRSPNKFSMHNFFKLSFPFFNWRYFECARQGWNVFTYKVCANRYPGIFNFLWYAGKVLAENNKREETTGKLISWVRYRAIGNKWYVKTFKKIFSRKIDKLYPTGIGEAFAIYHGGNDEVSKTLRELSKGVR